MQRFRAGEIRVLVATTVWYPAAGRGSRAALAIVESDPLLERHAALRWELSLRTGGEALWASEFG